MVVLGAGAAGLAAARDLSHAGLRVTVVEARPRIGGRILTLHDPRSPLPVELGAEFIHGEAPETFAVAEAARLMVVELPDQVDVARDGRFTPHGNFWGMVDQMNHALAKRVARRSKDFPVSEYLRQVRPPARRQLLQDFVEGFHAAYPERLSARSLAGESDGDDESAGREHKQFRIPSGYAALAQWLHDGLDPARTEVRLSTVAEVLAWKGGDVRLTFRGGDGMPLEPLRARVAVVTLPHAVLKAGGLRFDPPLPAKQRALAAIETSQVFKIVLRFRRAFWNEPEFLETRRRRGRGKSIGAGLTFLQAPGAELLTWWTTLPVRTPLLTGWVGAKGAEALLAQEPAIRLERSLVALSAVLAVPRRELEDLLESWASHDWRADPFSRGAYSYVRVDGAAAPRALARPVERTLFFAGEATHGDQMGTVAGALESGRRAAREVLRSVL